jgi:hypothetical protein
LIFNREQKDINKLKKIKNMSIQKVNQEEIILSGPESSDVTDFETQETIEVPESDFMSTIDQAKISEIESKIQEKKEEIKNKVYAVNMSEATFNKFCDFMSTKAEWSGTEALGIKEVNKQLEKINKDGGVKNSVIYLGALPLEASHYFLSKSKGAGLKSAEDFLTIYKALDQALNDAKNDAVEIKNLEKELNASLQGIDLA